MATQQDKPDAGQERARAPKGEQTPFVVNGQRVSEEEYFKAAEKSPWDVQFLRERKYYPEIVTK